MIGIKFWFHHLTDEVLASICGRNPPADITSYSNEISIVFQSGSRVYNRQGFRLEFNTSVEGCGGEVSGPNGVITSPGYPNAYPHGRICIYKIRGSPGRRITLTFTDFGLEEPTGRRQEGSTNCHDFIYVIWCLFHCDV